MQCRVAMAAGAPPAELARLHGELAAATAAMLAAMRAAPVQPAGDGLFQFDVQQDVVAVLLAMDRLVLDGERAIQAAFDHLEAGLAVGGLARQLGGGPVDLVRVRTGLLPAKGALLAFWFSPAGGHVLAIDHRRGVHTTFAVDDALRDDLRTLRLSLEQPPADRTAAGLAALRATGGRVAERLLPAPVRALLEGVSGRRGAAATAPSKGLFLVRVEYNC